VVMEATGVAAAGVAATERCIARTGLQ